jgi:hypothetical protein
MMVIHIWPAGDALRGKPRGDVRLKFFKRAWDPVVATRCGQGRGHSSFRGPTTRSGCGSDMPSNGNRAGARLSCVLVHYHALRLYPRWFWAYFNSSCTRQIWTTLVLMGAQCSAQVGRLMKHVNRESSSRMLNTMAAFWIVTKYKSVAASIISLVLALMLKNFQESQEYLCLCAVGVEGRNRSNMLPGWWPII